MRTKVLVAAAVLLNAAGVFAAAPRVAFVRTVPATYSIDAERLAVIYAIGDTEHVNDFVAELAGAIERSGAYHIVNASENNQHLVTDEAALRALRREHPADAYLGVTAFTCRATERSAEGSERDAAGERVKRIHHWIDVTCDGRVHVMDANGKKLFSYTVRGEGTSPRSTALTYDERAIAYGQAAHYAGVSAAQSITPRRVRESIELDDTAPAFEEGWVMVSVDRLDDARKTWEAALLRYRDSAPLRFNLAAICEAAGDVKAATAYYEAAATLSADKRFARELDLFRKRNLGRK